MVTALHAHLASVTKYRRGVPTAEHTVLPEVFTKACRDVGATLAEHDGQTTTHTCWPNTRRRYPTPRRRGG